MKKLRPVLLLLVTICCGAVAVAQTDSAAISGRIVDNSGAVVVGADVRVTNIDTNVEHPTTTNGEGFYLVPNLKAGRYRIIIKKEGFRQIVKTEIVLHVQDVVAENFKLQLGAVSEAITVTGDELHVNTEDATVSTVVDRQFAENLPMNGRSFQTLIQLAPGVVPATSNLGDGGQFNVNGQRASANYWTVDGVSANIGIGASFFTTGNGLGGSLGSFSASGGTNSLVSVDALQEFRIQTSTYAPEFGRTPGGQISIVTRSGTNRFHGSVFDYFRNDALDAADWFNGYTNNPPLPKAAERQNDFGGTFEGPILKNRTFFFFSYEGLRLRLPRVQRTTVPCDSSCTVSGNARALAQPPMRPFLNAYPLPNGPEVFCDPTTDPTCPPSGLTGSAEFNASYSDPSTLDAYSIRIDHKINDKLFLFGRYNLSPSGFIQRGAEVTSLSALLSSNIRTETETVGATFVPSASVTNDLRLNYSRTEAKGAWTLDHFGAAVPLVSLPIPNPYNARNAEFSIDIGSLVGSAITVGKSVRNVQRQINIVDNLTLQRGSHSLKVGVDYRRLFPISSPVSYLQKAFFNTVSSASAGNVDSAAIVGAGLGATFLFRNLGIFAQDTWRIIPRLTMTYGVRWDVDFVPSTLSGPKFAAVTGFDLNDLSGLALAPVGTLPFKTSYHNLAPRLGLAYQVSQAANWGTTIRGGFGVFYDLATSEAGNNLNPLAYPFGSFKLCIPGIPAAGCPNSLTFPLDPSSAAPPPISADSLSSAGVLGAFDPNLDLPYSLEWNAAVEQGLGKQQSISASYIGSTGRRLIQTALVFSPNPNFSEANLVTNGATSDYSALQLQFQRRLSHGLQSLVSYTWAHSIDTASAGSAFTTNINALVPGSQNRGPSDFDIRDALSAAVTYEIQALRRSRLVDQVVRSWSLQSIIHLQSASPVNVFETPFDTLRAFGTQLRPDVVPGIPLYLHGSQFPGGKAINGTPGAVPGECPDGSPSVGPFCPPPVGPDGLPTGQGNLGRNALRGFGLAQWDLSVHRDFAIRESLKLQFRAEMFNVLNHPNFGPLSGCLGLGCGTPFGVASQTLAQSLGANVGSGGFDRLYQLGGPRSIQLALKLSF